MVILFAERGGVVKTIDVPVAPLIHLLVSFVPTVLLMDIKGDELELLTGMSDLRPIKKIIMETHQQWVGSEAVKSMIRHLYSTGFDFDLQLSGAGKVFLSRE